MQIKGFDFILYIIALGLIGIGIGIGYLIYS
jgi:hypothetical protein